MLHYPENQTRSWNIYNGIPELTGQRRLAVQQSNACRDKETDIISNSINNEGDYTIWDEGQFQLETKNKIKILLRAEGNKFNGNYILLNPSWGRWTKRKIWVLEKLRVSLSSFLLKQESSKEWDGK